MYRVQKDPHTRNVVPWVLFSSIIVVGIFDAVFKAYALTHFPGEQDAVLHPVLALAVHKNPGVAFNLPIPHAIVIPLTIAIAIIFLYRITTDLRHGAHRQAAASFAVIIGALGNLFDRLLNGFTTDYLIFFRLSAINLSDVLIVLGIIGVLWYDQRHPQRPVPPGAS